MTDTATTTATQAIIDRHDKGLSFNYGRYPIAMIRGQGAHLWDAEGKRYLDLFAGFGGPLLGHCHADLVEAVTEQAHKLWHVGNLFHTEPQTRAAEAIGTHGFGGLCFFGHSGADANEAAIKLARLHGIARPGAGGPRFKIVTTLNSFHGRTMGAMTATGQDVVHEGFGPLPAGFVHVPYNDYPAMAAALDDETCGVLIEPIQGEGGVHVPDDDYLPRLRELCDQRDVLLMVDEVWTGCGRTGRYFAYQHWDIEPDTMSLAKGVGGGLPVGVMCASPRVAKYFDYREQGKVVHASTLGGNCLAMAVTAKIFEVLERDRLVERADRLGAHAAERLRAFAASCPAVKAVRGHGLFLGIELDPNAQGAWFDAGKQVVDRCLERGVLINACQDTVLRLAPALTIEQDQFDEGLALVEDVIRG